MGFGALAEVQGVGLSASSAGAGDVKEEKESPLQYDLNHVRVILC